jgi:SlyX protein
MEELQERLTDLEIRYSHQTLLIDQLNEFVTQAWARLDQLEKACGVLRDHLLRLTPDDLTLSPDE